jgi:3-methyl-2-oxobutanoate hydroxymethyltransferase
MAEEVKMQGGKEKSLHHQGIADAGVPVMSHVGMCPHFMHLYGGFKLQGKTADEAMRIIEVGIAIEAAGACGFEVEAVPVPVAKAVDDAVEIFTFGIGAGSASCGQLRGGQGRLLSRCRSRLFHEGRGDSETTVGGA